MKHARYAQNYRKGSGLNDNNWQHLLRLVVLAELAVLAVLAVPYLLSQLLQSVVLLPVGVLPGGDLDVGDVAVEVGRAALERRHQLVQRIERHLLGFFISQL